MKDLISSHEASSLICLPSQSEPDICENADHEGMLIGLSERLNLPVMLHPQDLVNPHMLICGMTGGGKTFLARSIISRAHAQCGFNFIVIDFTGEYSGIAEAIGASSSQPQDAFGKEQCSVYINLHSIPEPKKIDAASNAFDAAAGAMRSRRSSRQVFILIDEAWKLIEKNRSLETIIREGRKYSVGLITSSQLLHDTSQSILSNMATIFIFKTTNARSLDTFSKSFGLSDQELARVADLDRGSCIAIQLRRSGARSVFVIKNVIGIRDTEQISIMGRISMKISVTEFDALVADLCGEGKIAALREQAQASQIGLADLIRAMMENGADRRRVLPRLQRMGFSNAELADAFSAAMHMVESRASARDATNVAAARMGDVNGSK